MLKLAALFVLATMITAVAGTAGSVFAQEGIIETSAGAHDGSFFGEGVLRIIVDDPDAEDDNTVEELQVNIKAQPESGPAPTESFLVPETTDSSGRFELFLVHVDATAVGPDDLDPTNSAGVEGDGACVAECAPFVTFGPGGDIDIQSELYEEISFEFATGDVEAEASYEETSAGLELDRNSYGTTSYVYISVVDQDANLNPTQRDEFTVDPDSDPNDDLLALGGGTFEDAVVFRETGDNTAVFEGRYRLGESMLVSSESLALTLFDKANYGATLAAPENDSNFTDEISFTVGNSDGTIEVGGGQITTWDPAFVTDKDSYALGEVVHVTTTDQDANVDAGEVELIQLQVSSGSSSIEVSAIETGADTGIFAASFQLAEETDAEAGAIAPGGSATVTYTDERPADYSEKVQAGQNPEKDFTLEIDIELPVKTGVEATGVTAPVPTDVTGGGGYTDVGKLIVLTTMVSNNNEAPQPFVALIEVRDSNGVTVFLAWQGGTLDPTGSTQIGVSWQPDLPGTFEVRTFVVSGIGAGAEVLSPVAVSEITVT